MGILPFDTLTPLVLYHIYETTIVNGYDTMDAAYLASVIDADVTASYVKMALKQLSTQNDIEYEVTRNAVSGESRTGKVLITAKGIKAVEKYLLNRDSIVSNFQRSGLDGVELPFVGIGVAPAADRIVAFSDNERAGGEARQAVEKLKDKLVQANDLPPALSENKDIILGEIEALQSLISQTAVRAVVVVALARKLFPWIVDKAGGAAIGELAKRALSLIIDWLT